MKEVVDSLGQNPVIGMGGSIGGLWGAVVMTTPIFQFLSALFGSIIGLVTVIGMTYRFLNWIKGLKK